MTRSEQAIFTNMCMIYNEGYILVQDRQNLDWPGITFPGGHVEHGNLKSSKEGDVFWIERENLCEYKLAPDFLDMFNIFESDNLSEFYYYKEHGKWQKKLL